MNLNRARFLGRFGSGSHLDSALDYHSNEVKETAASSSHISHDQIDKILKHGNVWAKIGVAKNPKISPEQLHTAIKLDDGGVTYAAASNPSATPEHLDAISKTEGFKSDFLTRKLVAEHPSAQKHHLSAALKDEYGVVNRAAKDNPNYKLYTK